MAKDLLDPGPDGTYPYVPRRPDGTVDADKIPSGLVKMRRRDQAGNPVIVDLTLRLPDGRPITDLDPLPGGSTA